VLDHASGGGGFRVKSPKPSCWSSVSGALLEMVVEGDGGMWWGGIYKVVVVWWYRIWSRKWGRRALAQKSKTEPLGLGFGCTIGNGGGGRWGDVVGWYIQGGGGVVVPRLVVQVGVASFSPKVEN
jgi:hypothetical protein